MAKTYVPGYGYVDSNEAGTSGSVGSSSSSNNGTPSTGSYWRNRNTTTTTSSSNDSASGSSYTSYQDWRNSQTRYDNTLPISYTPPVTTWMSADRQEQQIGSLPAIYRAQTIGDALNLYWSDPASKQIIVNAARVYYKDYSNYNDQWAEGFWSDIVNQANNPGAAAPWVTLQNILAGQVTPDGAGSSSGGSGGYSGGGGGYSGGGGGGGTGQVSLTNPSSARGLLVQTMQGLLGRDPTDREYKDFLKTLNQAEMNNPVTVSMDGSTVVQSGGVDPNAVASGFAETRKDAKEYKTSRYTDMLLSVIGSM